MTWLMHERMNRCGRRRKGQARQHICSEATDHQLKARDENGEGETTEGTVGEDDGERGPEARVQAAVGGHTQEQFRSAVRLDHDGQQDREGPTE